jgi:hypothetical protein
MKTAVITKVLKVTEGRKEGRKGTGNDSYEDVAERCVAFCGLFYYTAIVSDYMASNKISGE